MFFNSIEFFLFIVVVYGLYLVLSHKWQNWLLIVASCVFYATWNWKFLFLMFVSISTDFWCAQYIAQTQDVKKKRVILCISLIVNLTILGFFKYYNFFIDSFLQLLQSVRLVDSSLDLTLNIILPLGISFYTFEAISYVVDVYRGQIKPAKRYWDYVLFVIYFPHLIAGPIMRGRDFLPQVASPRRLQLNQFYEGCHLIFWGLFEKVFIADNLAKLVNPVFADSGPYQAGHVLVALYAFAFQIFCDFDGYSNIARGLGKCMGFELGINFRLPYFATNPTEFWHRWHITLSTWLRDYIYIPLGGSRKGELRMYGSLLLTMIIGGLWHGASWTFVLWGGYHGVLLCAHKIMTRFKSVQPTLLSESIGWKLVKMFLFFHALILGWLLFRATSMNQVIEMLYSLKGVFNDPDFVKLLLNLFLIIAPLLLVQWAQARWNNLMVVYCLPKVVKIAIYALMTYLIVGFGVMQAQEFIYFQF